MLFWPLPCGFKRKVPARGWPRASEVVKRRRLGGNSARISIPVSVAIRDVITAHTKPRLLGTGALFRLSFAPTDERVGYFSNGCVSRAAVGCEEPASFSGKR